MTVTCVCCDRPGDPSAAMPTMRTSCWLALPQVTRELYLHGGIPKPRLIEAARTRTLSLSRIGGGQHTR